MALATLADTKRYIPDSDSIDDALLTPHLEAAEEWVIRTLGREFGETASPTETFNFVREGSILHLDNENPSSIVVTGYLMQGSDGEVMTEDSTWAELPGGKIEMIFDRFGAPSGLPNATIELRALTWFKIEVSYTASATVPAPIREAVAMIAAAGYIDAVMGSAANQIISERLGDYSYSRESSGSRLPIPTKARLYMRPYSKRHRVRST